MHRSSAPSQLRKSGFALAFGVTAITLSAQSSKASYIVTYQPDGLGDIVANGSGTLNTAALTPLQGTSVASASVSAGYITGHSQEFVGPLGQVSTSVYTGNIGGSNFGTGNTHFPNSGSGDMVGISETTAILVPAGYVSGSALSDSDTFNASTLLSLGLTPGTYTSSWGSGATADSFSVVISNSAVPEPTTLAVLGIPAAIALLRRRRVI